MAGNTSKMYPRELKERAVRLVTEVRGDHESEWAAMTKVAHLLGVSTPETVRKSLRHKRNGPGRTAGVTTEGSPRTGSAQQRPATGPTRSSARD